jgi:uncharacterized protein with NRDE domain
MCIVAIAIGQHPRYPIIVASNRDEWLARPTRALAPWADGASSIVGGRDLQDGGTWLGVNAQGTIALITNFRDPSEYKPHAPSRGGIVVDALNHAGDADDFMAALRPRVGQYRGFNFAFIYKNQAFVLESRSNTLHTLGAGVHAFSNGRVHAPWPKCSRLKAKVSAALSTPDVGEALLAALTDTARADTDALPHTGVTPEIEHTLSAIYVTERAGYGTRTSSVILRAARSVEFLAQEHAATLDAPAGELRRYRIDGLAWG